MALQTSRRGEALLLVGLLLPLLFAGFLTAEMFGGESGAEMVTIRISEGGHCSNPTVSADGSSWHTSDSTADRTWLSGGTFEAEFTWRGNRGTLHTPSETMDYSRQTGRFGPMDCAIG